MPKQTILTQEYFEEHLSKSLKNLRSGMTKDLKTHVSKEIENLGAMNAREFDRVHQKLVKIESNQSNHEKRLKTVEKAIGMPEVA